MAVNCIADEENTPFVPIRSSKGRTELGPYDWVANRVEASKHVEDLRRELIEWPYLGIEVRCCFDEVCLVQLASATRAVVLDALALKDVMRELLQPLLSDIRVSKVFHGHVHLTWWLSSNYGLTVHEPIFDTLTLAQTIDVSWEYYGQPSLQLLCKLYFDYDLDETYHMADWRQRPMPTEIIQNAAIHAQVLLHLREAECNWLRAAAGLNSSMLL